MKNFTKIQYNDNTGNTQKLKDGIPQNGATLIFFLKDKMSVASLKALCL